MGIIVVYTGPMKSGKTSLLVNKYNELKEDKVMLKPYIDDRFSNNAVVSRNNDIAYATNITNTNDLKKFAKMYTNLFIDEFQFIVGSIKDLTDLRDLDINIYIAGLNLTAEKTNFGLMHELLNVADTIYLLKGNCDLCGKENCAEYTKCLVNKKDDILIGDSQYICVCENCYNHGIYLGQAK